VGQGLLIHEVSRYIFKITWKKYTGFCVVNLMRERDNWGVLDVEGWIILGCILVGKPEGRKPLGRPRCRWVNNIRMDLGGETGGKETTGET